MAETSLTESLWWVLPSRLGGMRKPGTEEIPALTELGIDAIVSVMDDPSNLDRYGQAGIPHLWLPTPGGQAPTLEQIETFVRFVDLQQDQGRSVVVHCSSGRRRTGTFLAAYLIQAGHTPARAIAAIARCNPQVELREAQTSFLQALPCGDTGQPTPAG